MSASVGAAWDPAVAASANLRVRDVLVESATGHHVRVLCVDVLLRVVWCIGLWEGGRLSASSLESFTGRIARGELEWTVDHTYNPKPWLGLVVVSNADGSAARNMPRMREKERALVERHRTLLAPLMAAAGDGSLFARQASAVAELAEGAGESRTTVGRVLRRWLQGGMTEAALGSNWHRSGGRGKSRTYTDRKPGKAHADVPRGVPLSLEILEAIDWGILWLDRNPRQPRVDGFIAMNGKFFATGRSIKVGKELVPELVPEHLRPTESQFLRRCRKLLPERKRVAARRGEKYDRMNVAPVFGTTSGRSFGPGSMSHLDSTPAAIRLVDTETRSVDLGQPRVYFVIDDFSSAITGRAISMAAECTEDGLIAVADSMTGYIRAPRAIGDSQQLPDIEKPMTREGFTDKGSGYLSALNDAVYRRMRAAVSNPETGMANHRGRAEQRFNMARAFLDWLPGAISKRRRGRGDLKRGADAALTVAEFKEVVDEFILYHNSTHRPEGAPPESVLPDGRFRTAFELYAWGIANRGAPDLADADTVRLCLFPQFLATVDGHGGGLVVENCYYKPKGDAEAVPKLDFSRQGGRAKGTWIVIRNPDRIGDAWLLIDDGTEMLALEPLPRSQAYAHLTQVEWTALQASRSKAELRARADELTLRTASLQVVKRIADKAVKLRAPKLREGPVNALREAETAASRTVDRQSLHALAQAQDDAGIVGLEDEDVPKAAPPPPSGMARASSYDDDDVDEFRSVSQRLRQGTEAA